MNDLFNTRGRPIIRRQILRVLLAAYGCSGADDGSAGTWPSIGRYCFRRKLLRAGASVFARLAGPARICGKVSFWQGGLSAMLSIGTSTWSIHQQKASFACLWFDDYIVEGDAIPWNCPTPAISPLTLRPRPFDPDCPSSYQRRIRACFASADVTVGVPYDKSWGLKIQRGNFAVQEPY